MKRILHNQIIFKRSGVSVISSKTKKHDSLRWKLVSTYFVLITFVILLAVLIINRHFEYSEVYKAKERLIRVSETISREIRQPDSHLLEDAFHLHLKTIVERELMLENARAFVQTTDSLILYDSESLLRGVYRKLHFGEPSAKSIMIYASEDSHILYSYIPLERIGISIYITQRIEGLFDTVHEAVDYMLFVFVVVGLISVILSIYFAELLIYPIEKLIASVQKISAGSYGTKVDYTRKDELGTLGEAFNDMSAKLFYVEETRKRFVSNVSHELRTPMTSIKILADTLLGAPTWNEAVYRDFLNDINIEIDRLNNIIDSLLKLARLEKNELELHKVTAPVNDIVSWAVNMLRPIADSKHIAITETYLSNVKTKLDQEKMKQAILNILHNAVKYTPDKGEVDIIVNETREDVVIQVIDTGIGIPSKSIPFVFDRFYRVDEARARKTGGSGLGLSIVQQIIVLHQGEIKIDSVLNVGTKVTVTLPKI